MIAWKWADQPKRIIAALLVNLGADKEKRTRAKKVSYIDKLNLTIDLITQ